jgi:hypothetical protein
MRPKSAVMTLAVIGGLVIAPLTASAAITPARPAGPASPLVGHWSRVTATGLGNNTEIGLARGRDGVLHVLWTSQVSGKYRVSDTQLAASGRVLKTVILAKGLYAASDPDATATSKGLDAFWNGQKTSSISTGIGTFRATRPLRGGLWHLAGVIPPASIYWASSVAAAPGSTGIPWVTFQFGGISSGFAVLNYVGPEQALPVSTGCCFNEGIGADSRTGTAWLTYYGYASGRTSIYYDRLTPTGSSAGPAVRMPGSETTGNNVPLDGRVTATGRGGGKPGVYVSYVTGAPVRGVKLLRLGSGKAATAANVAAASQISGTRLAADPAGRIWVAWWGGTIGHPTLFVSRSNATATKLSRAVRVRLPAGASVLYRAYVSAQSRKADIVALLIVNGKIAYWDTQVPAP